MENKKNIGIMRLKWVAAVCLLVAICIFGGFIRANAADLDNSLEKFQSAFIFCDNDVVVVERGEYGFERLLYLSGEGIILPKQLTQKLFTNAVKDICAHNNPEEVVK